MDWVSCFCIAVDDSCLHGVNLRHGAALLRGLTVRGVGHSNEVHRQPVLELDPSPREISATCLRLRLHALDTFIALR